MNRHLSSLQVAVLLISASYGIGFLFGSGEQSLSSGFAGSYYAVLTAFGMLILSCFSKLLWRKNHLTWDAFNGVSLFARKMAAIVSGIWLIGILTVQIHGVIAILNTIGINKIYSIFIVCFSIILVSQFNIKYLTTLLTAFMLFTILILIFVVFKLNSLELLLHAPKLFIGEMQDISGFELLSTAFVIIFLVIFGADYQQFIMEAKSSNSAVIGSFIAFIVLTLLAFIPSTIVVASIDQGVIDKDTYSKSVIPLIFSRIFEYKYGLFINLGLSISAISSSLAINRAINISFSKIITHEKANTILKFLPTILACLLTLVSTTMIELITTFNSIFIAALLIPLISTLSKEKLQAFYLNTSMLIGIISPIILFSFKILLALDISGNTILLISLLLSCLPFIYYKIKITL